MKKFVVILCLVMSGCVSPTSHYPDIDKAELELERQKQQEFANNKKINDRERRALKRVDQQRRLINVSTKILKGGVELCNKFVNAKYGCVYEFELSKEKSVNAYADGKKIVISPAMMNFADKDEELAIVLGHEYAHNVMGHINAKQQNMLLGNLFGIALDAAASSQGLSTGSAFGKMGASAGAMHYSQEFEKEADYIGLYVTYLSGFDIKQAPEFWRKMSLRNEAAITNGVTHPTNPERYIALDKTIREIKNKKKNGKILLPNIRKLD